MLNCTLLTFSIAFFYIPIHNIIYIQIPEQTAYIRLLLLPEEVVGPSFKEKLELGSKSHSPRPAYWIMDHWYSSVNLAVRISRPSWILEKGLRISPRVWLYPWRAPVFTWIAVLAPGRLELLRVAMSRSIQTRTLLLPRPTVLTQPPIPNQFAFPASHTLHTALLYSESGACLRKLTPRSTEKAGKKA